jgi:hypothetical protein
LISLGATALFGGRVVRLVSHYEAEYNEIDGLSYLSFFMLPGPFRLAAFPCNTGMPVLLCDGGEKSIYQKGDVDC